MPKGELPYEESAERRSGIEGWVCKTCRRYWGDDEHTARWCCAKDVPCACGNRVEKTWTKCEACRRLSEDRAWDAMEKVEWDGVTPICLYRDDRYFFSEDDFVCWADDRIADGMDPSRIRAVLCVKSDRPHFEMAEFLYDYCQTADDNLASTLATKEIDAIVNDWIARNVTQMWEPSNVGIVLPSSLPVPEPEPIE